MNSSRTKLVLTALLGSITVAAILLLVLNPGSPPVGPQSQGSGDDRPAEGLVSDPMAGQTAVGETDEAATAGRQVLVPPEDETPGMTISGRVLADPRVSVTGGVIVAYPGERGDQKGAFSNLWANLALPDSAERPGFIMQLTGEPVARTDVEADGSFRLEGIREPHVRLAMEHDFYGLKQPEPVHVAEGESEVDVGDLETYLGAHVIGNLVGPGRSDAVVAIAADPDPLAPMRDPDGFMSMIFRSGTLEARSDDEGGFEFRALWPSPKVRLVLRSEEYSGRTEVFSLAPGETREILLGTHAGLSVHALVRNQDNEPVSQAKVTVIPTDIRSDTGRAIARRDKRTDGDGACTVSGLWSGSFRVTVEATGYRSMAEEIELRGAGGESQLVEFALDEGGSVTGVVVNREGEPIEGANVAHMPSMEIPMLGDVMGALGRDIPARIASESPFLTDEEGRFKVTGLEDEGGFHVVAAHEDYLSSDVEDVHMGDELTIELERGARIVGTVVAAESEDVIPSFTVESLVSMMMIIERPTQIRTVRDSSDGRFEIDKVVPGTAKLRFRAEGRAETTKRVRVQAGEEVDVGIVALRQHAIIRGEVLGADGRPVSGATVSRKTGGMNNPMLTAFFGGSGAADTDENGQFELEGISPGRLILVAQVEGHASGQSDRLQVAAGEVLDGVVIQLGTGGSIAGQLLLPLGESFDGWHIIPGQVPSGATNAGIAPEADGSFRLDNLDPGRYAVTAMNMDRMMEFESYSGGDFRSGQGLDLGGLFEQIQDTYVTVNCVVKAGETTEVELDATELGNPGVTLEVTVRLGDRPMANGWAEIRALDSMNQMVGMVNEGVMKLSGLKPGSLRVQVRSGITYAPVGEPTILEVPEGEQIHRVDLNLPGGEIHGRVIDDVSGEALSGTMVRLIHEGANLDEDDMFGFVLTNEDGQFQFLGLADGTYGLAAGGQFTPTEAGRVTASTLRGIRLTGSDKVEGLQLRARPEAGATVLVTNEVGAPLPGALLLAVDEEGNPLGSMGLTFTGPDGRGEFGGLPEGSFRIVGRSAGLAPGATRARDIAAGQHVDLILRLGTGPRVTLSITDERGTRLTGATLSARTQDSPWFPATLLVQNRAADGTLGIGPVPAGTWEFRVFHPDTGMFQVTREIPQAERASLILSPK